MSRKAAVATADNRFDQKKWNFECPCCQLEIEFLFYLLMVFMQIELLKIVQKIGSKSGNPYWTGKLTTVDPLVLNSLVDLVLIKQTFLYFFTTQATLMRSSIVLCLPFLSVFPGQNVQSNNPVQNLPKTFFLVSVPPDK